MRHSSLLGDLIDLYAALRADRAVDPDEKKKRDRAIGTQLPWGKHQPARQLRGWLGHAEIPDRERTGQAATQLHRLVGALLVAIGLITGWGLAQAALHYTGDAPINIVNVLAVLVLPQLLLLLFWCIAALPVRLPPLEALRASFGFLHPGRLARAMVRRLPSAAGHGMEVLWNADNAVAMAPAVRWLVSFWSQLFSVAFNLGALFALFYLVTFSDLAFGWSTTLALGNDRFHGFVSALSWPWHAWVPQAVPDMDLVEATRYYRLTSVPDDGQAPQFGGWWPFLVAALVTYGLLPRVITLAISWQRLRHHLREALVHLPGAPELLARMNSPLVSTAALRPETARTLDTTAASPRAHAATGSQPFSLVAWSGSITTADTLRPRLATLGIEPQGLLHAGGARSMDEDRAAIDALCAQRVQGVAMVVKAWEPPLLEFVDFVQQLRARCNDRRPILILLWGGDAAVNGRDLDAWTLTLRPLRDPDLYIEAIP